MFRRDFDPQQHVVPGLFDFLDKLAEQKMPIAVATSAPVENADYILTRLSLSKYLTATLDSSNVENGKPDPEIYLKAAAAIHCDPENCIVFEDSLSGIKAGLAAGATVVGLTTTHSSEEISNCHLTIDDFKKLTPARLLRLKSSI